MTHRQIAPAFLALAATSACAHASIVYDAITGAQVSLAMFGEQEYAEEATLSTGAATPIAQVELAAIKTPGFIGTYTGMMTVHLYADTANGPGALFGSAQVPISLPDTAAHIFTATFTNTTAPTATIWISSTFIAQFGPGQVLTMSTPSVGSSTGRIAYNSGGPWFTNPPSSEHGYFRINTVPTPGTVLAGGAWGAWVLGRARRRARV